MTEIKQYEMKFFLNTSKALIKEGVLPVSYTWEITCKIEANDLAAGRIYQLIDEQITTLKTNFEKNNQQLSAKEVADRLFDLLTNHLKENDLLLTYLKVNSSPMIGYEIVKDKWS